MITIQKIMFIVLGALTIQVNIYAEGVSTRKATQVKHYAVKKNGINSKISLAEQCLQEKLSRLNDAKSLFEKAKQEVHDAYINVNRAKEETKELDRWYRGLQPRAGDTNQVTEVQTYASKKELLDNKIHDLQKVFQAKEFEATKRKHAVEEAQQAVNTATQELKNAQDELVVLDTWYNSLAD